ncbi:MAG: N-6 DNA methylase [Cocleimonas sp.]|nr:N-6 DNA methylase [Cocleimonas sp.]
MKKTDNKILFINPNQSIKLSNTQDVLIPEHINKIVETYKNRNTRHKYSYLAHFDEVKASDFNLNVSRYVDTFEAEQTIDLIAVRQQRKIIQILNNAEQETITLEQKLKGLNNSSLMLKYLKPP